MPAAAGPRGVGAGISARRVSVAAVGILLLLLIAFAVYSFAFKVWCARYERAWASEAWGTKIFGEELGNCVEDKSWLSF
jgi:hypothetical protein